jgi:hypothetical protein
MITSHRPGLKNPFSRPDTVILQLAGVALGTAFTVMPVWWCEEREKVGDVTHP